MKEPQTLSEELASHLSNLILNDLPSDLVKAVKRSVLDTLGAALAGISTQEVKILINAALEWGSAGRSRVWGSSRLLSAPHAALVNGTAAHAREVDDFGGCGHSGAVVVPAVLGAAELSGAGGDEVIPAIIAGYETAVRVTDALGGYKAHNAHGWHSTGTAGVFGAAAGAGRVLRLNAAQMAWALGLAGTFTGGVWAFIVDGAMSKRLHAGKAAEAGLVAALLAQKEFTGPKAIFEDTWGSFITLYGAGKVDRNALVREIGQDWTGIFRSGFKPYACCRGIHSSLDAAFSIKEEFDLAAEDIDRVIVYGTQQTAKQLGKKDIFNVLDAQFSLPYSVALAFVIGRAGLEEYEEPYFRNQHLIDFSQKVDVVVKPELPLEAEPELEVHIKDGRVIRRTVRIARGDSRNPLSDADLSRKFQSLAKRTLPKAQYDQVEEMVWRLDTMPSVAPLLESLRVID